MTALRSYLQTLMAIDDRPRVLEAGQVLFKEGDLGSEMFIIRTGSVTLHGTDGRTLETVTPPGLIGEMALIDPAPRSATAIAGPDCSVTAVNEYMFVDLVRKVPGLAIEMMKILAQRIRRANQARAAAAAASSAAAPAQKKKKAPAARRPAGRKKPTARKKPAAARARRRSK
jgi:CRP/FNR family cyclic AMP-dependent transcriptional regulator